LLNNLPKVVFLQANFLAANAVTCTSGYFLSFVGPADQLFLPLAAFECDVF